jgi:hypothetical protein
MIIRMGSWAGRIEKAGLRGALVLGLCLCASACDDTEIAWKVQSKSPDGYWIAEAINTMAGGFGDSTDTTNVFLTMAKNEKFRSVVISLSPEGARSGGVKLTWLSKRHLEVQYDGKTEVDFQAIKCADVEISLRHVDVVSPLS